MTPLQQKRQRQLAMMNAGKDPGNIVAHGNLHELMMIQLVDHKKQLKGTQSVERKAEIKTKILPDYIPYISGTLEADSGAQDEIVMTIMLWRIDVGDIQGALEIAEYALRHDLQTPEQFNRDTATLIAEEVAEIALRMDEPDIKQLIHTLEITKEKDMPDEVRAKLHKAIGTALGESNVDLALEHLNRALQLHKKSGVIKQIEKLNSIKRKKDAAQQAALEKQQAQATHNNPEEKQEAKSEEEKQEEVEQKAEEPGFPENTVN